MNVVCLTRFWPSFHFVLVLPSRLAPRRDGGLRKGFDVAFPCNSASIFLQFAFLRRLAPPATLAVRRRFLTVVCLIIEPFSSRLPATLAVRGRFLTVVCLILVSAFPLITCLRVFPGFIAKRFKGGEFFSRSRICDSCSPPKFPYFCICGSSGWTSVMVRPRKGGNYLQNR